MSAYKVVGVFAAAMALTTVAGAQTFTGGLRGAARDANGVIPGARVELINEQTGQARAMLTNEAGEYNFPAMAPGTYTLKVSFTGFKNYESRGLRIGAQQFLTIDVPLEVGTVEETITITGQASLLDTSNASTGTVMNFQQLSILPNGGRRRSCSPPRSRRSLPPVIRGSTASRIRPTLRCCRSAEGRAAATTI